MHRCLDDYTAQQVAGAATTNRLNTLIAQTKKFTCLRLRWNLQFNATVQCWHFQLATQSCIDKIDRNFTVQIAPVSNKYLVRSNRYFHVEIASGTSVSSSLTLTGQTYAVTHIDSGGHLHRQRLGLFYIATAVTGITGVFNLFAGTLTARTSLLHREETLLHAYLTVTTTGRTVDRLAALLGSASCTGLTGNGSRNSNLDRCALHCLFEA